MAQQQDDTRETRTVKAVDTALDIVDTLCELNGATVTELSDHLNISTSAVHTHLQTLESRGYVTRDDYSYRPSLRFFSIGEMVRREHVRIYAAGRAEIKDLAEETGEFGWLMIEADGEGLYVYKERVETAVETGNFPPGRSIPLHCTASGKAILAHLPEQRVDAILDDADLEAMTPNTITSRTELLSELDEIRTQGYALSSEESVHGVRSVAAPVLTADQTVIGAVGISGPVSRIKGDRFKQELPAKLIECSNVIEIKAISKRSEFETN